MDNGDPRQEQAHEAVSTIISRDDDVPDDAVLVSWTLVYEYAVPQTGCRHVGYLRGPETVTEWAQRGLLDMARALLDAGVTAYEMRNGDD